MGYDADLLIAIGRWFWDELKFLAATHICFRILRSRPNQLLNNESLF